MWVFVAKVTNGVILGLDILRAYDASVDLGAKLCVWQRKRYRYEAKERDPVLPAWWWPRIK
jgi:hypothetical protein